MSSLRTRGSYVFFESASWRMRSSHFIRTISVTLIPLRQLADGGRRVSSIKSLALSLLTPPTIWCHPCEREDLTYVVIASEGADGDLLNEMKLVVRSVSHCDQSQLFFERSEKFSLTSGGALTCLAIVRRTSAGHKTPHRMNPIACLDS